jgi:hypothetical protein
MEPPVFRIVILLKTIRTHCEVRHGGVRPVIGDRSGDGIPGPAIRTVDEGIKESPVGGIEQFPEAIIADRDVGRYEGKWTTSRGISTGKNGKMRVPFMGQRSYGEIGYPGERRRFAANALDKIGNPCSLDVNQDPFTGVRYISLEIERLREVIDSGPETNALHDAIDYDLNPLNHVAHASIPAPLVQETSKIFSFGLSASESFRTLFMSVFM